MKTTPAGVSPELTISRPSVFAVVSYPLSDAAAQTSSIGAKAAVGGGDRDGSGSGAAASSSGGGGGGSRATADGGMGQSVQKRFEHLPGIGSVPVVLNLGEVSTEIHLPQQVAYLEVRKSMLQREIRIIPLHPVFHPISVDDTVVPVDGMEVKHDSIVDFAPFVGRNGNGIGDGSLRYQMKFDMPNELMVFT